MNKYEYLSQLRDGISSLQKEDRDAAMSYYEEFFSDAGEENVDAVIASLGTPQALAQSIIAESANSADASGFVAPETPKQSAERQGTRWTGTQIALLVIVLVLTSPLWLGLVCGLFGALVGIVCGVFGATVAIGVSGIVALIAGIITVFAQPAAGLLGIGTGLVLIGLVPLAFYPLCKLIIKLIIVIIKGIGALINKMAGNTGVAK